MHKLVFTLLGTGSSGGVPRVGNQWGSCDPTNSKNRRRRCALLVRRIKERPIDEKRPEEKRPEENRPEENRIEKNREAATTLVIDTGADLREQLLSEHVTALDGVLLTHSHADHIFGLDDLRQLAMHMRKPAEVYMDQFTSNIVMQAFGYCFHQAEGSSYPAFCREIRIEHPQPFSINGLGGRVAVQSILAEHGDINALGFRIADLVYLPDAKRITDADSLTRLDNIDTLVVDALRYKNHPTHMNVDEALEFIAQVAPRRAILTNMHSDLDFVQLSKKLPAGVEAGYDGLTITLPAE
ncbi:MAG: MBL fold metallo-hydrolase [Granulosicoccus sp.]|nr:MBL fold metallo-hydrolase [Granulosicoccus sp.]